MKLFAYYNDSTTVGAGILSVPFNSASKETCLLGLLWNKEYRGLDIEILFIRLTIKAQ